MNSSSKSITNTNNSSNDSDDLSDFEEEEGDYEDDEATLDEEEQLVKGGDGSDEEDNADELRLLAEEGEMSVEELRRKYLGSDDFALDSGSPSSSNDSHEVGPQQPGCSTSAPATSASTYTDKYGYFALKTSAIYEGGEDEEEDEEYAPPEFWKKSARVGPEFQVNQLPNIPFNKSNKTSNGSSSSSTSIQYLAHPAETMWTPCPNSCPMNKVEKYLFDCEKLRLESTNSSALTIFPVLQTRIAQSQNPAEVFDDENALHALLKNNYNVEKAKAEGPFPWPSLQCVNGARLTYTQPWRSFNEADCAEFESALRVYGKNFWAIKKHKMSERTVGELIRFYYIWKKTERHDIFVEKNKQAHQTQRSAADSVNTTDFMGGIMDILNGGNGTDLVYSTQIELETTSAVRSQVSNSLGTNIPSSPMSSSKGWLHVGSSSGTPTSSAKYAGQKKD